MAYDKFQAVTFCLWRIFIVSFCTFLVHHLVMCPIIYPVVFSIIASEDSFVQTFINTNSAFKWLTNSETNFFGAKLAANGQSATDLALYVLGTQIVHIFIYITLVAFFYACDRFKLFQYYKIPREAKTVPSASLIRQTLIEFTFSMSFTAPIILSLMFVYISKHWKNFNSLEDLNRWTSENGEASSATAEATPFYFQIAYFLTANLINEFGFYFAHRFFHENSFMYKYVHRQHHQYTGPISISAEFANPIESIIANLVPIFMFFSASSLRVPMSAWFTFLFMRLVEAIESHSGYDFRTTLLWEIGFWSGNTALHDMHHTGNVDCFGIYLTDYLFDTCDHFAGSKKEKSNRLKAQVEIDCEKMGRKLY